MENSIYNKKLQMLRISNILFDLSNISVSRIPALYESDLYHIEKILHEFGITYIEYERTSDLIVIKLNVGQ